MQNIVINEVMARRNSGMEAEEKGEKQWERQNTSVGVEIEGGRSRLTRKMMRDEGKTDEMRNETLTKEEDKDERVGSG